jgi:hypothetical protein
MTPNPSRLVLLLAILVITSAASAQVCFTVPDDKPGRCGTSSSCEWICVVAPVSRPTALKTTKALDVAVTARALPTESPQVQPSSNDTNASAPDRPKTIAESKPHTKQGDSAPKQHAPDALPSSKTGL